MTTPTAIAPVTYQNVGAQTGFLIVKRGQGTTVNIYNGDIANVLLVSPSPSPGLTNSLPIQPLTNATVDASSGQYASAMPGQTVSEVVVSAASQLSPSPAQIAAQISALGLATAVNQASQITQETATAGNTGSTATNTGNTVTAVGTSNGYLGGTSSGALIGTAGNTIGKEVSGLLAGGSVSSTPGGIPLLRFTKNIGSGSGSTIAGATTATLISTTSINQPGYEAEFMVNMPASSGTVPFVKVIVVWTDATTGLTVGQRTFFMTCGNGPTNALPFYLSGPARGNQVSLTITNLDPSITATFTWGFNMTSHVYLTDKLVQGAFGATAPNGYSNPSGFPNAGVLLNSNPSIPASSTTTRLAAAYSGKGIFGVDNTGTVAFSAFLVDPSAATNGLYGNPSSRYSGISGLAGGASFQGEVALPYGPLQLQIVNAQTSAASGNFGLIAEDY